MYMVNYAREPRFVRGWIKGGLSAIKGKVGREDAYAGVELVEDDKFSYHYAIEPYLQLEEGQWAFSVWAKMPTGGRRYLRIKSRTDSCDVDNIFDLQEKLNLTTALPLSEDEYGWALCEAVGTVLDDTPFNVMIMLGEDQDSFDYKGDKSSSVYVDEFTIEPYEEDLSGYVTFGGSFVSFDGDNITFLH